MMTIDLIVVTGEATSPHNSSSREELSEWSFFFTNGIKKWNERAFDPMYVAWRILTGGTNECSSSEHLS